MNDEIKLMLNIIKDVSEHKEGSRNGLMILSCKDYKTLYDYITNLQQENDNMEKIIKQNKYKKRILELEEVCSFLQQENERLNKEKNDYKSRCEKTSNKLKRDYYINYNEHNDNVIDEALNILQNGSDSR